MTLALIWLVSFFLVALVVGYGISLESKVFEVVGTATVRILAVSCLFLAALCWIALQIGFEVIKVIKSLLGIKE